MKVSVGFMILAALVCHQMAGPLIGLFMKTESIVAYGAAFLQGFALSLPFLAVDFLAVGVFQACGLGKNSLIFCHYAQGCARNPGAMPAELPVPAVWAGVRQLVAEVILCIAAVVVLRHLFTTMDSRQAAAALSDD